MTTNPESLVIEEIDRLETDWAAQDAIIDQRLAQDEGFDDYHRPWHDRGGQVLCQICLQEWHGLATSGGCPSEFGTDDEKAVYQENRTRATAAFREKMAHHYVERVETDDDTYLRVSLLPPRSPRPPLVGNHPIAVGGPVMRASPEMARALTEHVTRYPEDEQELMRRFGNMIFSGDGTPVPWTIGGLRTVLGGNPTAVAWAIRQLHMDTPEE